MAAAAKLADRSGSLKHSRMNGHPNNQINGKGDGGMDTLCRCAEAMSSAGIGL